MLESVGLKILSTYIKKKNQNLHYSSNFALSNNTQNLESTSIFFYHTHDDGTNRTILSLHILFCSGVTESMHHSCLVFVYTSLRNLGHMKDQREYLGGERNVIFIDWDVLADRRGSQCPDRKSHSGEPPPGSTSQRSEVRSIEHEWQHLHINIPTWVRGLERHWDLASRLLFR